MPPPRLSKRSGQVTLTSMSVSCSTLSRTRPECGRDGQDDDPGARGEIRCGGTGALRRADSIRCSAPSPAAQRRARIGAGMSSAPTESVHCRLLHTHVPVSVVRAARGSPLQECYSSVFALTRSHPEFSGQIALNGVQKEGSAPNRHAKWPEPLLTGLAGMDIAKVSANILALTPDGGVATLTPSPDSFSRRPSTVCRSCARILHAACGSALTLCPIPLTAPATTLRGPE
ncbi:hypothetical protein C8D88_106236 [Lentzea atacamensis]|uniref:Uncharacterized protein n=1 Tax=Lentzea atacamensis TaxID=531938 RepID=A0A316I054_9PSEU|nr:hypothetical protein C8D88_106236 [Lentzea atacamensis]